MSEIILYDHPASPCARRVRIALIEKGVRWRSRPIDLEHLEQKSPWYLALNPNGIVPTLQHGARVVWESNVITEYLDAVFPEPRAHQLVVVRLVARRAPELGDPGLVGDVDPDLGDEHALEVEARDGRMRHDGLS